MHIAITGASGRVGSAVVARALAEGHSVVCIDRVAPHAPDSAFIEADLTRYDELAQALNGCDALVHLAAIASPGHQPDHEVHNNNVVSSYNALRAAAAVGIRRVCQASSINATGGIYSRVPRYDYFPVDEQHPTYNEDPYSLSKWMCEQQADSIARRFEHMSIASLRLHGVRFERVNAQQFDHERNVIAAKHLWGWVLRDAVARACLLALAAPFSGHEVFYIVAPETMSATPSLELRDAFYPQVPVRGDLSGTTAFYSCAKAARLLGWQHDE